jgi:hypothetical protein
MPGRNLWPHGASLPPARYGTRWQRKLVALTQSCHRTRCKSRWGLRSQVYNTRVPPSDRRYAFGGEVVEYVRRRKTCKSTGQVVYIVAIPNEAFS